jgi:nucleoside-diphosphate-sugar epimerase
LIDGLIALAARNVPSATPVNIGNPEEFTVLELAGLVREVTGISCDIVLRPLPQDDPRQRRPDITRATELLGWQPKVGIREGLEKTVEFFKNSSRGT